MFASRHNLPIHRLVGALLLTIAVIAAAGCAASSAEVPVDGTNVVVDDNQFEPEHLTVAVGDTVTWTWQGTRDHNVVSDGFESKVQASGSFTHTFEDPGTYDYACSLHGGMRGTITVTG